MTERPRAYKYQTLLAEKRDRADRARALLMLEEMLSDDEERAFQASKELLGLKEEGSVDQDLETYDEFLEHFESDGKRYLFTRNEHKVVIKKLLFLMVLKTEQESRDGIFHDSQVVLVETAPMRVIVRQFLTPETCRKRLALIADREGYEAERAWLLAKLT